MPAVGAELGPARSARARFAGPIASRRTTSRAPARGAGRPAAAKPPPMTTSSGSKMLTRVPIARAEPLADLAEDPRAPARRPRARAARAVRASAAGPKAARAAASLPSRTRTPRGGPRPVQVPWHGRPSSSMTMCPSSAPARAVELPAEDHAAADAGAEREHDHRARARAGADAPLGEGGRVRVVVDADRQPEPLARIEPVEVRRRASGMLTEPSARARALVDACDGTPIPTAATSGAEQLAHGLRRARRAARSCDSVGVGRSTALDARRRRGRRGPRRSSSRRGRRR